MEYRNVHRNRKEANVAGAESAGRKWKEMRSGKQPKARSWPYRPLKDIEFYTKCGKHKKIETEGIKSSLKNRSSEEEMPNIS